PPLASSADSANWALGGRPGFFFTTSSAATLAFFFTSSLAVAFSECLAGDFVCGTGFTFMADLAGGLACGLGSVLTTLSFALAGTTGLINLLATGFAGFTSFPDF